MNEQEIIRVVLMTTGVVFWGVLAVLFLGAALWFVMDKLFRHFELLVILYDFTLNRKKFMKWMEQNVVKCDACGLPITESKKTSVTNAICMNGA